MKKLALTFVMIFSVVAVINAQSREEKKKLKDQKAEAYYQDVKAMIGSGTFVFNAKWMYPQAQRRRLVLSRAAFLNFNDGFAEGKFPYFGMVRGAGSAHDGGGIEFKGEVKDYEASFDDDKRKIAVSFKIADKEERYFVEIRLFQKRAVKVTINSDKRDSIAFDGQFSALEE